MPFFPVLFSFFASAATFSAPYVNVEAKFDFDVVDVPNDLPSYPEEPIPGNMRKLTHFQWSVSIEPSDINVEIDKLTVIAYGKTGSKRLIFMANTLRDHVSNYQESGELPLRCFTNPEGAVRLETELWIRQINDDGSIMREPRARTFVVKKMPPFVPLNERHTGSVNELCDRN